MECLHVLLVNFQKLKQTGIFFFLDLFTVTYRVQNNINNNNRKILLHKKCIAYIFYIKTYYLKKKFNSLQFIAFSF